MEALQEKVEKLDQKVKKIDSDLAVLKKAEERNSRQIENLFNKVTQDNIALMGEMRKNLELQREQSKGIGFIKGALIFGGLGVGGASAVGGDNISQVLSVLQTVL